MAKLLRKVKHRRWIKSDAKHLLDIGDVPADPLGDLSTAQNTLSVFQADKGIAVERIARALAVGGQKLDDVGFIIFESSLLQEASIDIHPIDGTTEDLAVNQCHADLINLTGNKLATLARLMLTNGQVDIVLKKQIIELVKEGVDSKELPEKVREKLPKA